MIDSTDNNVHEKNHFGISVALRVRPMSENSDRPREKSVVQFPGVGQILIESATINRTFKFDVVFGPDAGQEDVFQHCGVTRLIDLAMEGYSCTCFAYGQTASGKTHTMTGPSNEFLTKSQPDAETFGLLPRAFVYLYNQLLDHRLASRVRVSYFEIYNEQLVDLLNPRPVYPLNVRWKQNRGFFVENLFVIECESANDLMEVLATGMRNRAFNPTHPNEFSSRSHSIFNIMVDTDVFDPDDPSVAFTKHGRIAFVDLAGSEKAKDGVDVSPEQLMETQTINRSLLVLGNCINALADPKKKGFHIPIRDSKLTKLLSDSLGGDGVTLMVACVSPSSASVTETMSTLRYASRARQIQNAPTIQLDPREQLIKDLKKEIRVLRKENKYLKENWSVVGRNEADSNAKPEVIIPPPKPMSSIASQTDLVAMASNLSDDRSSVKTTVTPPSRQEGVNESKSNTQITLSVGQSDAEFGLYEMLQEYMTENEGLRSENSGLHRFKTTTLREQEVLAQENDALTRRVDKLERLLRELQTEQQLNRRFDDQQQQQQYSQNEFLSNQNNRSYSFPTKIAYPNNAHDYLPNTINSDHGSSPQDDDSNHTYIIYSPHHHPLMNEEDNVTVNWEEENVNYNNNNNNLGGQRRPQQQQQRYFNNDTSRNYNKSTIVDSSSPRVLLPVQQVKVSYERNYENRRRKHQLARGVDHSPVQNNSFREPPPPPPPPPVPRKAPLPNIRKVVNNSGQINNSQDYEDINDKLRKELDDLEGIIHRQQRVNTIGQQLTQKTQRL